jgi:hypothetical protein
MFRQSVVDFLFSIFSNRSDVFASFLFGVCEGKMTVDCVLVNKLNSENEI